MKNSKESAMNGGNAVQIIRKILSATFAIIAIIGVILIANGIWGKPTKATDEFYTFIRGIIVLSYYIIFSGVLAYGLLRLKRWSLYIYWIFLTGHYLLDIPILFDTSYETLKKNLIEDILFILLFIFIPIIIGIILFKKRKEMFPKLQPE